MENAVTETKTNVNKARSSSSKLGFILVLILVVYYLIAYSIMHYLRFFKGINIQGTYIYFIVNYIPIYGIGTLLAFLLSKKVPAAPPVRSSLSPKSFIIFLVTAYGLGSATNLIASYLNLAITSNYNASEKIISMVSGNVWLSLIVMVIIAPVAEEFIFRKIIIDRLAMFSEKYAILVSALCFGLYHRNLQQFFYAAVLGAVFAYVYSRTGKIYYTMIMHGIFNALGFISSLVSPKVTPVLTGMLSGQYTISDFIAVLPYVLISMLISQAMMACCVLAVIFMIRKGSKIRFRTDGACQLAKGKDKLALFINPGIIVLAVLCVAVIVLQIIGIM